MDKEKEFHHESYGMLAFSRCQGSSGRLFGSALPKNNMFIQMRLKKGVRYHSLSHDRFMGKETIVEVSLSAVQFAELLTSMNMGDGVPCTIKYMADPVPHSFRELDEPPPMTTEAEEVELGFKEDLKDLGELLASHVREANKILAKSTITKADRDTLRRMFERSAMEVRSNMPFVLRSFQESVKKMSAAAKAEVDAFMTHGLVSLGLSALAEGKELPPMLPAKTSTK